MDAIQQQESQVDLFKTSAFIYMHCCDVTIFFYFNRTEFALSQTRRAFRTFQFFRFSVRKANVYFASQRATSEEIERAQVAGWLMCNRVLFSRYVFISVHCVFLSRFSSTTLLFSFAIFTTCTCNQNYRIFSIFTYYI